MRAAPHQRKLPVIGTLDGAIIPLHLIRIPMAAVYLAKGLRTPADDSNPQECHDRSWP